MSDEKRWTLAETFTGKRYVHGPKIGAISRVEVIPAEAAESKLAEVEGERDRLREKAALKMDDADAAVLRTEAQRESDRADKAEADLARATQAIKTVADSDEDNWTAGDCQQFAGHFLRLSPAQEQPRYTVEEVRERLLSDEAREAGERKWKAERGAVSAEIRLRYATGAQVDAAFPQPNTPTGGEHG